MRLLTAFAFVFLIAISASSQEDNKQQNTTGSELIADAPWRILKYNSTGSSSNLPLHIYIHDSDCSGCNNELSYIDVRVKPARNTDWSEILTFESLSQSGFLQLFTNGSLSTEMQGTQVFSESFPVSDPDHTILFTADTNGWIPVVPIVDITQKFFYFTFNISGDLLLPNEDVIDIEVTFGLDWESDQTVYLRVYKTSEMLPKIDNWYAGDTHYHGFFTQNNAELGLPLHQTKQACSSLGLDWLCFTDHSCDYDNYGNSMNDNWVKLGDEVQAYNAADTNLVMIRAIEMAINNSNGQVVHALTYPSPSNPLSMPYFGDGGGDLSYTNVTIDNLIDSLITYDAFCYAAHPFAEQDALSSLINGGIWNLSDTSFAENGQPHPSMGTVICNNTSVFSDIYDTTTINLIKPKICGGELWNLYNGLYTTEDIPNDPYNATYSQDFIGIADFPSTNPMHHQYRLFQNLDGYFSILKKGLQTKNNQPNIQNWKYFLSAGSDAHGSFNGSNTDMFAGISGNVNNNAPTRLFTSVFCPNGKGLNGENVLNALEKGNAVMSSGPMLAFSLYKNNELFGILGEDKMVSISDQITLHFTSATNSNYGAISLIRLYGGTENGESWIDLPIFDGNYDLNLSEAINQLWAENFVFNSYFYLRAELNTTKFYSLSQFDEYKKSSEIFSCYTNPIWLNVNSLTQINNTNLNSVFSIYPNPASNFINIQFPLDLQVKEVILFSIDGRKVMQFDYLQDNKIDIRNLAQGMYIVSLISSNGIRYEAKFVKR